MKKSTLSILVFSALCIICLSCKKNETPTEPDIKLKKVTNWNPTTGVEITAMELTYDDAGKPIKFSQDDSSYDIKYDSGGKISEFIGKDRSGYTLNYRFTYNSNGTLEKFIKTNDNPSATRVKEFTKTFNYSNNDQSIQTTIIYPSPLPSYSTSSTWDNSNMQSFITTEPYMNETEFSYDDQKNPYILIELICIATLGYPAPTKNNPLTYKLYNGATTTLIKRTYSYNEKGYPTSMKVEGSNEGRKFYYN